MIPRAFFNAVEGFLQAKKEDFELRRLQTFCQVVAWTKVESPQSLWKYNWELEEEKETKQIKDINKQRERAKQLDHTLKNRA
jgi:hypothetical protein